MLSLCHSGLSFYFNLIESCQIWPNYSNYEGQPSEANQMGSCLCLIPVLDLLH